MFNVDSPKFLPGRLMLESTRRICNKCNKDYCICNTPWSVQGELRNIHRKLDAIMAILDRRKNGQKQR